MKRTVVAAFSLLLMPWISPAQSTPKFQAPKNFNPQAQTNFGIMVVPGLGACPAVIHARHEPGLHAQRYVNGASKPEAPAMNLVVTLTASRAEITHASVAVHGLNGKTHLAQTDTLHAGQPDVSRALELSFVPDADQTVTSHLILPGFTSVSSIDVLSVTYADGSMWKPTEGRACRVAPDPFMLVTAQAAH
ncbi:MAG TPA: hypothetical protein VKR52_12115 [Terracidiphilus sp.]|nr:hypothetical protein [Terracidiphilus sp.]